MLEGREMPLTIIEGIKPEERKILDRRRGAPVSTTVTVARELKLLRERRTRRGRGLSSD